MAAFEEFPERERERERERFIHSDEGITQTKHMLPKNSLVQLDLDFLIISLFLCVY